MSKPRSSERQVEPVRRRLGRGRFERLVSALCSCVAFDSLFVLQVIRGVSPAQAEAITRWMAATMLQASVPGGVTGVFLYRRAGSRTVALNWSRSLPARNSSQRLHRLTLLRGGP